MKKKIRDSSSSECQDHEISLSNFWCGQGEAILKVLYKLVSLFLFDLWTWKLGLPSLYCRKACLLVWYFVCRNKPALCIPKARFNVSPKRYSPCSWLSMECPHLDEAVQLDLPVDLVNGSGQRKENASPNFNCICKNCQCFHDLKFDSHLMCNY